MSMGEPLKLKSSPFPGLLHWLGGVLRLNKGVVSHLRLHPKNGHKKGKINPYTQEALLP